MAARMFGGVALAVLSAAAPAGDFQTLSVDGRKVDVWKPSCAKEGAPIILSLHAWATSRNTQKSIDRFPEYVGEECPLIVYPQGKERGELFGLVGFSWNAGGCCPNANKDHVDDVGFLGKVISEVAEQLAGDENAVFAVGVSNGGMMANRLACSDDRVKAIVAVSGPLMNGTDSEAFRCDRSLPVLHFHGQDDGVVPFWGCNESSAISCRSMAGLPGFPPLPWQSVPEAMKDWRRRNGLSLSDEGRISFSNASAVCNSWGEAISNVTFCSLAGEGHAWPGACSMASMLPGMHCSLDMDGSLHAMEFFRRYMPRGLLV